VKQLAAGVGAGVSRTVGASEIQRWKKLRIGTFWMADRSRPPISLDTSVARTEGYAYAAKVWALFLVQGLFSVARLRFIPDPPRGVS
jgi:hypothetical protein